MTKNKLLKALSLLLTVSMLVISASFVSSALSSGDTGSNSAPETSDSGELGAPVLYGASDDGLETNGAPELADLEAKGGSVELDGTNDATVTVSLVTTDAITCYSIEGTWDTKEQEGDGHLALTELSSEVLDNDGFYVADKDSGKVIWAVLAFPSGTISANAKLLTATYTVDKDTPDGEYTVKFVSEVFTGEDGEPYETETTFTAKITVTHKAATTGLKGDVNLDGQVTLADAVALTRHVTEVELLTDATAIKNADVNGDGELSLADAVKLTRYTLDLETLD